MQARHAHALSAARVSAAGLVGVMLMSAASAVRAGPLNFAAEPAPIIRFRQAPFFPIGLYGFPKRTEDTDLYAELAEGGFNFYLRPARVTKDELDRAHAHGIRIMITLRETLNLSGSREQVEKRKAAIARHVGPDSMIFAHPAVVALEGPDEPLWIVKGRQQRDGTPREFCTWVHTESQRQGIYALLRGLKDGYAYVRELCGDRYSIWLNFAPRGHEQELRWFTGQATIGGYPADPRPAADVFGTDIYPIPDGGGNNGWVSGVRIGSPAAVGLYTDRLRRAVAPHPFYMVLQGCGILEWDPRQRPKAQRRPTLAETQYMAFEALVHGARGLLYWGTQYIEEDCLFWRDLRTVARQIRAFAPVLLEGQPWPEALAGSNMLHVLGMTWRGGHYLLVANPTDWTAAKVAVPGWIGPRAYSLLDGRTAVVENGVLSDQVDPLTVKLYTDATTLFEAFGRPTTIDANPPDPVPLVRGLFSLPTKLEPFQGKSPSQIAEILKRAGVDAVVKLPHDRALIRALHEAGIKAYAEIACFAGKGPWKDHPETRPITATGEPYDTEGNYGGLCLCQEGYVRDLLERVDRLMSEYPFDGLWLDFIRWPGRWEQKRPKLTPVCFCPTCLSEFSRDRGVHIPADLATTAEKASWILAHHAQAWYAWRCDRVADVVRRIRRIVKQRRGPDALLGIFAVPMRLADFDGAIIKTYGQDWRKLAPYVDVFSPMVYHIYCGRPLEWISQVTGEVQRLSGRSVWPIVQSCSVPAEMTSDEFVRAVREGAKAPAQGILIYSTTYTLKENKWEAMVKVYRELAGKGVPRAGGQTLRHSSGQLGGPGVLVSRIFPIGKGL